MYLLDINGRTIVIKKTLLNIHQNTPTERIKTIKYNNEWANLEIVAAKLAGLGGISTPWTLYFIPTSNAKPEAAKQDNVIKYNKIASQRLKGYMDLSAFLEYVNHNFLGVFFKDPEDQAKYRALYTQYKNIKDDKENCNLPDSKMTKIELLIKMLKMLPGAFSDMLDEAYVMSVWCGNWDMFNLSLDNIGFRVVHQEDGTITIDAAIIDFGNCLYAGFGGKYKQDSYDTANLPAKTKQNRPKDYDPEIPEDKKIPKSACIFGNVPYFSLGMIPRRLPFEKLFEKIEKKEYSQGFMRGLYRISLIKDESIYYTTRTWLHVNNLKHPAFKQYSTKKEDYYDAETLAETMIERRNYIAKHFSKEIEYYKKQYPEEAENIRIEVAFAAADLKDYDRRVLKNGNIISSL